MVTSLPASCLFGTDIYIYIYIYILVLMHLYTMWVTISTIIVHDCVCTLGSLAARCTYPANDESEVEKSEGNLMCMCVCECLLC